MEALRNPVPVAPDVPLLDRTLGLTGRDHAGSVATG